MKKEIEQIDYQGDQYFRINAEDINFKVMALVRRIDDEGDGSTFADYSSDSGSAEEEKYVAKVPFNFVIQDYNDHDIFIKKGGFIIYGSRGDKNKTGWITAVNGPKNRRASAFSKSHTLADDGDNRVISEVYKMVIAADRSPIAGIQFNNEDLKRAYERIGRDIGRRL